MPDPDPPARWDPDASASPLPGGEGGGSGGRGGRGGAAIRRYHSHTPGLLYIGFTLLLAVGAINSQNNLLFLALGLCIGGLLISGLISGASLLSLRVERRAPGRVAFGRPVRIQYTVTNSSRFMSAFGLHIVENEDRRRARSAALNPSTLPPPRAFVVHVPPAGTTPAEITITPRARGRISFSGVQIWSTFPFGLTKKSVTFNVPRTLLVLPPELPLRPGTIERLRMRNDVGEGAENAVGQGDEFFGLREYIPGDSPRRIAWKRSARTGQVVVRQHAAPSPPRLWVVLDVSTPATGSPREPRHVREDPPGLTQAALEERAIALCASILRTAVDQGIAVGLSIPAARVVHHPREGRAALDRLLTELALLEPASLRKAPDAPHGMAGAQWRGGGGGACIVIHAVSGGQAGDAPGAMHIDAADAHRHFAADEQTGPVLEALDAAGGGDRSAAPRDTPRRPRPLRGVVQRILAAKERE